MAGTPAAVVGLAKKGPDAVPRFLPVLVVLSVLLWFYTTTGGRQVFVKEVLGGAYDSQAEHFLQGNVDVDVAAIGHEAMIVDGKVRMYFGPFPAFLRIPLNFVYPAGHGKWSRVSGFCAGIIALCAFAGLMRIALQLLCTFLTGPQLGGKRMHCRVRARLAVAFATWKSFYLR